MFHSDVGIILRSYLYKESGLILVIGTEHHGIRHFIVKGAHSAKNKFSTALDLFYKIELSWKSSNKSTLETLTESQLLHPRSGISKNYTKVMMATYFTQLWEASLAEHQSSPELFDLLERALHFLHEKNPTLKALYHFENELSRLHGIAHPHQNADQSLKEFIGYLPKQREKVFTLLSTEI